jgi:hypothetical protein
MQGTEDALCILENGDNDSPTITTTINVLTAYNNNILNDLTLRF